jgi:hypothetical protein
MVKATIRHPTSACRKTGTAVERPPPGTLPWRKSRANLRFAHIAHGPGYALYALRSTS